MEEGQDKLCCSNLPLQMETMLGFLYVLCLSWSSLTVLGMTKFKVWFMLKEHKYICMLPMISPFIHCRQRAVPRRPLSKTSCQGDPVRWNVLVAESHRLRKHQDMVAERHLSSLFSVFYNLASPQPSSTLVLSLSLGERLFPPVLQVRELRCKKPDSEVFPKERKASCNCREYFDKALQPSKISSVLPTLMTSFLLSISSSSQGQHLHFASAPDAVLSANPSAGVVWIRGQRSSYLASWWIIVVNGNHLEDKSGSCSPSNEAARCTT